MELGSDGGGGDHQVRGERIVRLGPEDHQVRGREPAPDQIRAHVGIARHLGGPADLMNYPGDGLRSGLGLGVERGAASARLAARQPRWRCAIPGKGECCSAKAGEQQD